jgi:hypothetical protein
MRRLLLAACVAASSLPLAAQAAVQPSSNACAAPAIKQAAKLLAFHFGGDDDRMQVDDTVKPLPSIVNPANPKQRFDVLEVWASIYKGSYRMRFEYYRMADGDCLLMGQEILEYADI